MTYSILHDLTESRMYPSRSSLEKEDFQSLTEAAFLMIVTLRILLAEKSQYAQRYVRRMIVGSNFRQWRSNANDLYMVMHALTTGSYDPDGDEPDVISGAPFIRWLREMDNSDARDETETRKLFFRLDRLLEIKEASMRAIRRLVTEWPDLDKREKRLAVTRLLQMLRTRFPRSELLPVLSHAARVKDWEINDVCDPETGDNCPVERPKRGYKDPLKAEKKPTSFLASLAGLGAGAALGYAATRKKVKESDCGATTASSVATVVGGLGAGFDPNGHKGVYEPVVLRRGEAPKKKKR